MSSDADDAVEKALLHAAVEQIKADNRRLERKFEQDVLEMEGRFEKYVERAVFDAQQTNLDQRLKPLELIMKGMVALVLMGVGTAILNLVLTAS